MLLLPGFPSNFFFRFLYTFASGKSEKRLFQHQLCGYALLLSTRTHSVMLQDVVTFFTIKKQNAKIQKKKLCFTRLFLQTHDARQTETARPRDTMASSSPLNETSAFSPRCECCKRAAATLQCQQCHAGYYCSDECQTDHRARHEATCAHWKGDEAVDETEDEAALLPSRPEPWRVSPSVPNASNSAADGTEAADITEAADMTDIDEAASVFELLSLAFEEFCAGNASPHTTAKLFQAQSSAGLNVVHAAVTCGELELLGDLLQKHHALPDLPCARGITPLQCVAEHPDVGDETTRCQMAKLLLDAGADPHYCGGEPRRTAADCALEFDRLKLYAVIVRHPAFVLFGEVHRHLCSALVPGMVRELVHKYADSFWRQRSCRSLQCSQRETLTEGFRIHPAHEQEPEEHQLARWEDVVRRHACFQRVLASISSSARTRK
jgi:hypothetical protein